MADTISLKLIGLVFAIVTLAVTATAAVVASVGASQRDVQSIHLTR